MLEEVMANGRTGSDRSGRCCAQPRAGLAGARSADLVRASGHAHRTKQAAHLTAADQIVTAAPSLRTRGRCPYIRLEVHCPYRPQMGLRTLPYTAFDIVERPSEVGGCNYSLSIGSYHQRHWQSVEGL